MKIPCLREGLERDFQSSAPSRPAPPVQITGPPSSNRTAWSPRLSSSDRLQADANALSRPSLKPELPGLKPEEDRTRDDPSGISGVGIPEGDTLWDRGYTHCGTERIAETPPHRNLRLESVTPRREEIESDESLASGTLVAHGHSRSKRLVIRCRVCSGCLLPDHILADDSCLAPVSYPAVPGNLIEASLPQLNNLALDLRGLPECNAVIFLEGRDGHSVSLSVVAA